MTTTILPPLNTDMTPSTASAAAPNLISGQVEDDAQNKYAAGDQDPDNQAAADTHYRRVVGDINLPPPITAAMHNRPSAAAPNLTSGHSNGDTQSSSAAGDQILLDNQPSRDTHISPIVGDINLPPPSRRTIPTNHSAAAPNLPDNQITHDTQTSLVVEDPAAGRSHKAFDIQTCSTASGPILADPLLGLAAEVLDDLEKVRTANENRLRALTTPRDVADADGKYRGHGLTIEHPSVAQLTTIVIAIHDAEDQAVKNLERAMKNHPLGPWVKAQKGIGNKQAARLLATIRDPYWNDLYDRPRTVSELWAYCGLHVIRTSGSQTFPDAHAPGAAGSSCHTGGQASDDVQESIAAGVAPKRQRGARSNWNEDARKRVWLISASCIKQAESPYRAIYDAARIKYADALHPAECVRCGPKNKPAQPGSPLSAGHQHARAMRLMSKEILKDLWCEAKRIHEAAP